ncbi:MAG: ACT domain-containing protein [Candidatus Diapherotrites archaeon]|nr:ACT domain-containing protein [Candidatus Micrarchaeota archaeon]MBU1939705.1 ACT domain-containing protein [Candidatus Micrarchaeota archaeon]
MNTTKATEDYIRAHPVIKECLAKGLVNYSALARLIATELGIEKQGSFDAVLVACRRYAEKAGAEKGLEGKIIKLLKKSKFGMKNKITVVIFGGRAPVAKLTEFAAKITENGEPFHMIQGSNSVTLITSEDFLEDIKGKFSPFIESSRTGLVEIVLKSGKEIETTPGVVAYVTSLLAERGINILETMSSWTDTLFVIDEKDAAKAMEALKF